MLTCEQLIGFLTDYLEGNLSLPQRVTFEMHLALCGDCRAYLHNFKTTIAATKAALADGTDDCSAVVPEALVQAILASRNADG